MLNGFLNYIYRPNLSMKMDYTCRVCANKQNNVYWNAKEMMLGTGDEFGYFECPACGCLQIAEIPNDIQKYYPKEGYYSFSFVPPAKYSGWLGAFNRVAVRAMLLPKTFAEKVLGKIFRNKDLYFLKSAITNYQTKILDVGCGGGLKFLYPLHQAGFKNCLGCDPFIAHKHVYENGLTIEKKDLSEIGGNWDIICFNHSFEHLRNPLENLQKVNELLTDAGTCIIRIPTTSSDAWEDYREHWFQLDAPRHFFLHSVKSMELLANNAGLELDKVEYDSTHHQFTISERYKSGLTFSQRGHKNLWGKIAHVFKKLDYAKRAKLLNAQNRGDQAIFFLKKQGHRQLPN